MQRFFTYAEKYCTLTFEEKQFLNQHARIKVYKRNDFYLRAGEVRPNWCFVIEGGIAAIDYTDNDKELIHWVALQHDYFTGTKHPFSHHSTGLPLRILQKSIFMELPIAVITSAQQNHTGIAEFIQILKQHKLDQYTLQLKIMKSAAEKRYEQLVFHLPKLAYSLNTEQLLAFLNIDAKTYYTSLKRYLKRS